MPTTSPRARTSGPQTQAKRPGDLTGVQGQKLAKERDDSKADALAAAADAKVQDRQTALDTVVDYTHGGVVADDVELVDTPEEPAPATMRIRVNYPVEDMTFGREVVSPAVYDENGNVTKAAVLGRLNTYNFEEGVQYDVPFELGAHLKSLGYVYDF